MTLVPSGRRRLLHRGSRNPLVTGAALMVLPRIDIAFPRGRRSVAQGEEGLRPDAERKMVIWEDRKIVLFDNYPLLPTVRIEFPQDDGQPSENINDALVTLPDVPEKGAEAPTDVVEGIEDEPLPLSSEEDDEISLTELSSMTTLEGIDDNEEGMDDHPMIEEEVSPLARPSLSLGGILEDSDVLAEPEELISTLDLEDAPPVYDGPTEAICGGALVLVEGERGRRARDLMQTISLGILQNGRSVTYVATSQSVQDLIMEMFEKDNHIANYLPDHRLMCVPVYPLIEGRAASEDLLDKLMGSEQLQTTDVLVIDALSDFLNDRFDEMKCMHLLEYVQHLNAMGKAVFLMVNDGQKGILPLRLESTIQLSLPAEGSGLVQMKRYQPSHQGALELLRFHIDAEAGMLVHPLPRVSS